MVHGNTLLVLPFTGLPLPVTAAIALAVTWSFIKAWRTQVLLTHPAAVRSLRWGDANDWQLTRQDGTMLHTSLQPRVFIHPRLVILRFRNTWRQSYSVVLVTDRLDPEIFRKLRVRLLIEIKQLSCPAAT
jgi:hypothetical protein